MSIFEFNGRPFLLKTEKISKAERRIYELITADKFMISYPYEVKTEGGIRLTSFRNLNDDEVRTLLDENDSRPLVDRVDWEGCSDYFMREYGTTVTVKRIAPVAHLTFQCSIIDEYMTASTYAMPLLLEDHVYLTQWIMERADYNIKDLKKTRPDLYARITNKDRRPRKLQPTSILLLTSAEQNVCNLSDLEPECDEVYALNHEDGSMSHICAEVTENNEIIVHAETATINDIENGGLLAITDAEKFKMHTGAYMPESILRTIGCMYHGLETKLNHIARYCKHNKIEYDMSDLPSDQDTPTE